MEAFDHDSLSFHGLENEVHDQPSGGLTGLLHLSQERSKDP